MFNNWHGYVIAGHKHTPMQENKNKWNTLVNGICAPQPKQSCEFLFQGFKFQSKLTQDLKPICHAERL